MAPRGNVRDRRTVVTGTKETSHADSCALSSREDVSGGIVRELSRILLRE